MPGLLSTQIVHEVKCQCVLAHRAVIQAHALRIDDTLKAVLPYKQVMPQVPLYL